MAFRKRIAIVMAVALMLTSSVVGVLLPNGNASADTAPLLVNAKVQSQIDPYAYRYALADCLAFARLSSSDAFSTFVTRSDIKSGRWFSDGSNWWTGNANKVYVGWLMNPSDAKKGCYESNFITAAVQALGWTGSDLTQAACDLGFYDTKNASSCLKGTNNMGLHSKGVTDYYKIIDQKAGRNLDISMLTKTQAYLFYARSMELGCQITYHSYLDVAPADEIKLMDNGNIAGWLFTLVNSASMDAPKDTIVTPGGSTDKKTPVPILAGNSGSGSEGSGTPVLAGTYMSCIDLASELKKDGRPDAYLAYISNPANTDGNSNPGTQASDTKGSGTSPGASTCGIGGIGWIVCPVLTFLGEINDNAFAFLANNFLQVDTGLVSGDAVVKTWDSFRNIANIAFVIVFMIIIFSQVTSIGVTNYGIKRMIPRLIITAVLVNMSLIVCQLAVDLSNVVGWSVGNLFSSIPIDQATGQPSVGIVVSGEAVKWSAIVITSLAGVALLFAVSVPVLIAALLALLMIVLIIIGRQAIIVLLVILSPIAFVAYLLPNTENLFKKWYKLFYTMLLLFPIIGIVFGASKLAANIIASTPPSNGVDPNIIKVMALGVSAVPFFVVPGLLKGALDATGKLGTTLSGLSSKANSRLQGKVKTDSQLGRGWSAAMANRTQNRAAKQMTGLARAPVARGLARLAGGKGFGASLVNQAAAIEDKDFEEGVTASKSKFPDMTFSDIEAVANDSRASEVNRTAAIRHIMDKGNFAQRQKLIESSSVMTARQKAAVSDGAIARGDHMIYGASIGDAIKKGLVRGGDDTQKLVAQNIAAGKIKPEAMVHDADAVKLMADVLNSGKQFEVAKKDAAGNIMLDAAGNALKETRSLTPQERGEVSKAAKDAQRLPGTSSKVSKLFTDQYTRL